MVQIKFGTKEIQDGELITSDIAQQNIFITWNANLNKFYTLIIYDIDAPYPSPRNTNSPYCHALITGIPGMDVAKGNMILPYIPPSPPIDSEPHRYYVNIYEQIFFIDTKMVVKREKFNIENFVKQYGLTLFDKMEFKVINKLSTISQRSLIAFSPSQTRTLPVLPSTTGIVSPIISPPISPKFKSKRRKESTAGIQYFKVGTTLTDQEQKYCRCIVHVAAEQPGACNLEKAWFEERDNRICYNPYAVCAHTVGTTTRNCSENYKFDNFPDDELVAYANLHKIKSPEPYDRNIMLEKIYSWKAMGK